MALAALDENVCPPKKAGNSRVVTSTRRTTRSARAALGVIVCKMRELID